MRALGRDTQLHNIVVGDCPPVAGMGRLCIDNKMDFVWLGSRGEPPYLRPSGGKPIHLRVDNYCPYLDDSECARAGCTATVCNGQVSVCETAGANALPQTFGGASSSGSSNQPVDTAASEGQVVPQGGAEGPKQGPETQASSVQKAPVTESVTKGNLGVIENKSPS